MAVYALLVWFDLLCFKSLQQLANDLSGEVIIAPGKKLEDLIHLAELCVDLLQQNEEHYAEKKWLLKVLSLFRIENLLGLSLKRSLMLDEVIGLVEEHDHVDMASDEKVAIDLMLSTNVCDVKTDGKPGVETNVSPSTADYDMVMQAMEWDTLLPKL
uniref:MUN domain-containing protein n=1 Tax=Timema genevievae TaxID=629358 RepID=A0A7R9JR24_TIMGE|nr:unnamed protein product [Timema genevievae]